MKFATSAALFAGLAAVSAQVNLPSTIPILGFPFGQQCQQTVLGLFTNSSFGQCFPAPALLPLLSSNGSIIPVLDNFMTELCYMQPCSNATLTQAAQTIEAGCASDLATSKVSNQTIATIFGLYPLIREVLCLKTSNPYTAQSYGGFLGAPPIPISSAYNQTNGTFCVSSVLTQLSAYFGTNLTIPFIASAVTGANSTAQQLALGIQPNFACNECLFGGIDVVEAAYPALGQVPIAAILQYANVSYPDQTATVNSLLNSTCAYKPLAVNTTQLPAGIVVSIVNSTFPNAPANGPATTMST